MLRARFLFAAATAVVLLLFTGTSHAEEPPVIAAAADLKFALEEVSVLFKKETGKEVKLSFGSSGNAFRQIVQGAPFQLFLSADEEYVLQLAKDGLAMDEGVLYAIGRIVLFAPHGSPLRPDAELNDLRAAINDGRLKKLAIANPEHAPYGRCAREVLIKAGLWDKVHDRLIFGDNIIQATQFAANGSTQGGIIAYSFALAPEVSKLGIFSLIPEDWHEPLRQRMALLKGAGETAKRFYEFVQTPPARQIFIRYGFVLPGE
ncbi:molybdate ABC transporter substrate-binding protein [Desulforhabdus amnigena]|uniref:Molybdate ABC transporter substrate-binding protein n=1 Tax=Desulforhabdus amnigena TaxID=40218 RepID=A0A9W6FVA9_9BACT|nr:molybdate ABC transporter substrate-binding protein [Desulforhabdus amnigena]GLI35560.1 molybdate ABC transporter substrate-binding protein [Desulforhabdus amnigena]